MSQYFPKPYEPFGGGINVKVDLSNYATKANLKNATGIDIFKLAAKSDLASLKAEIDKLDIDKLVSVPVDLSKLGDVVTNDIVKKLVYDKLVAKVNSIETSRFVLKAKYDTDKSDLEKKIPDTSGLVKKTFYNAKITEIENKIPSIGDLATNAALTTVENKIPNVSSLIKGTDYHTKSTEIEKKLTDHDHEKYITALEFNNLTARAFTARLAQANFVAKTDFDDKLRSLNQKITSNKTKHLLVENELKKLQTVDSIYFRGKSHFEEDDTQNYLVFQPMYKFFKRVVNSDFILEWKSKELSDESIKYPSTPNSFLNPKLSSYVDKMGEICSESCLKQDKVTYTHGKIADTHIVYEISKNLNKKQLFNTRKFFIWSC